jgi:probable rRNA maturation factor
VIRAHIRNLQKKLSPDRRLIRKIIRTVCCNEIACADVEVTLCLVTDEAIRDLNSRFHQCDAPTDVLAFPLSESPEQIIADIFVSTDSAVSQAREYKTGGPFEMYLYVIHGLLHIAGYDDLNGPARQAMRRKEKEYLTLLDIK